jgi:Mn-dependent DtxR family transcriptional regulator
LSANFFDTLHKIDDLIEAGTIKDSQAWLLLRIYRLSRTNGEGCWATNRYLAKKHNVSIRQIIREIMKLVELGLVIYSPEKVIRNGHAVRTLETKFPN